MIYNACWYKAFSASCAVHLVMALFLAMLIGNIDVSQQPEQHLVIELTEITGSDSEGNAPEAMSSAAAPVSYTLPVKTNDARPAKAAATYSHIASPAGQTAVGGESPVSAIQTGGAAGGSGQGSAAQPATGLGSAGAGTGTAGAGGHDINAIINAFLARVEKSKEYPYMARKRGQVGTVTVAVRLTAAGDLAGAHIVRSSGVAALDEAALKLVRRVCPFAHNAGRVIAMNIPITYNLN